MYLFKSFRLALVLVVAGAAFSCVLPAYGQNGWTEFTASVLTTKIYVSTSTGNDAFSGFSEFTPVRTLAKAQELARDGFPDWILLRRGDVWDEHFGNWEKSGASAAAPMLISTYGSGPRPIIRPGTDNNGFRVLNIPVAHLALVGLRFQGPSNPFSNRRAGLSVLGPIDDFLIEDCLIESFDVNVSLHAFAGPVTNVRLRRSIVADSLSLDAISTGLYVDTAEGVLIEECLFDHNGWREGVLPKSQFNRNVYIQWNAKDVIFRRNISARSSASGVAMRPGGIVDDNLFVANPIGAGFGSSFPKSVLGGVGGSMSGNVVLHGNDIESAGHGWGLWVSNIGETESLQMENNIVAHVDSAVAGTAIQFAAILDEVSNVTMENNIVYNWGGALKVHGSQLAENLVRENRFFVSDGSSYLVDFILVPSFDPNLISFEDNHYGANTSLWYHIIKGVFGGVFAQEWYNFFSWRGLGIETAPLMTIPNFLDPNRTVETYNAAIGGPADLDDFLTKARSLSRNNWDTRYTAEPVLSYVREGFLAQAPKIKGGGYAEVGSTVILDVQNINPGSSFQWYHDGVPMSGETVSSMLLPEVDYDDSGFYSVQVSQGGFDVTAGPVPVLVVANLSTGSAYMRWILVVAIGMVALGVFRRVRVRSFARLRSR